MRVILPVINYFSSAVLEIKCPSGNVIVGQSEDTERKAPIQKIKRQRKNNSQHGLNGHYT